MAERVTVYGQEIPVSLHHQGKYIYWRAVLPVRGGKSITVQEKTLEKLQESLKKKIPVGYPAASPESYHIEFIEWLWKWYEIHYKAWSETTAGTYYYTIRRMTPFYAPYTLGTLTHEAAQKLIFDMMDDGLNNRALERINNVAKQSMDWAIVCGYIRFNPLEGIKLPMISRKERLPIEHREFPGFLEALKRSPRKNVLAVMTFGGLRLGECRGLCWQDVNFQAQTLTICRQRKNAFDGKGHTCQKLCEMTKNGRCQTIHPPAVLFDFLKDEKERQNFFQSKNPYWQNSEGYVFTDPNGCPVSIGSISKALHEVGLAINRPELTPHYLRHTAGTMMFELTGDIRLTQDFLRHSDPRTTTIYVHSSEENKRKAMMLYDRYIRDRRLTDAMDNFEY